MKPFNFPLQTLASIAETSVQLTSSCATAWPCVSCSVLVLLPDQGDHWKLPSSDRSPSRAESLVSVTGEVGGHQRRQAALNIGWHLSAGCHYLRSSVCPNKNRAKLKEEASSNLSATLTTPFYSICACRKCGTQQQISLIMEMPTAGTNVTFPSGKLRWRFPHSL